MRAGLRPRDRHPLSTGRDRAGTVEPALGLVHRSVGLDHRTSDSARSVVSAKSRRLRSADPGRRRRQITTGSMTLANSISPGDGVRSGNTKPSSDEVAVVQFLAEVTAVGEELPTIRGQNLPHTVIHPLPDEPAGASRVLVEQLLVLQQAAGPVAHGVTVFALQETAIARRCASSVGSRVRRFGSRLTDHLDLDVARVHAAVHVDIARVPVALVVHRAARVAVVDPRAHRGQVGDPWPLSLPRDHRTTQAWFLSRSSVRCDPVEVRRQPAWVVAGIVRASRPTKKPCVSRSVLQHHPQTRTRRTARGSAGWGG